MLKLDELYRRVRTGLGPTFRHGLTMARKNADCCAWYRSRPGSTDALEVWAFSKRFAGARLGDRGYPPCSLIVDFGICYRFIPPLMFVSDWRKSSAEARRHLQKIHARPPIGYCHFRQTLLSDTRSGNIVWRVRWTGSDLMDRLAAIPPAVEEQALPWFEHFREARNGLAEVEARLGKRDLSYGMRADSYELARQLASYLGETEKAQRYQRLREENRDAEYKAFYD